MTNHDVRPSMEPRASLARVYRVLRRSAFVVRTRWFRTSVRPPLYESTVLDDLLFWQPFNVIPRLERFVGRHRSERREGTSVVIVNFNTRHLLDVVLGAVRTLSPPDTELIVVDNASTDGSREWLSTKPFGVRVVKLPVNIGHGRALDIGIFRARRPIVVTLDSDAFPYADSWLDLVTRPIRANACAAAGMWGPRDRLHPACAAYRRRAVLESGISLANYNLHADRGEPPEFGVNTWDTAELLFERLGRDAVQLFPVQRTAFGGYDMASVVYHHAGSTTIVTDPDGRDDRAHAEGWQAAVRALLRS